VQLWGHRYYQDGPSPQTDVIEVKMFAFLALILQVGHKVKGRLYDYWAKMEQLSVTDCHVFKTQGDFFEVCIEAKLFKQK